MSFTSKGLPKQPLFFVLIYFFLIGWRMTVFRFSGATFRASDR